MKILTHFLPLIQNNRLAKVGVMSLTVFVFLASNVQVFAQEFSSGIATYLKVEEQNVPTGSILSFTKDGYKLTRVAYDPMSYGVVTSDPSVSLENPSESGTYPIITTGKAFIRVSNANGQIRAGSLIASSTTAGVGQLATSDGYVVATALEDFDATDPGTVGTVYASLNPGFNTDSTQLRQNLFSNFQKVFVSPFATPVNTFRYLIAGLAVLVGLVIGLMHFGRSTAQGIEAMGRNPLARNAIFLSMIMNLLLTLAAMGAGLGIAYLILSL